MNTETEGYRHKKIGSRKKIGTGTQSDDYIGT